MSTVTNLEATVRSVVESLVKMDALFTALDVSNAVKQQLPLTKHREVREIVRTMFATDIEPQGWARTPIVVNLDDGSTAEALLYHPLADSWDLDNRYDTQKRTATSYRPVALAQVTAGPAPQVFVVTAPVAAPAPVTTPAAQTSTLPTRALWDQMFQSQPSLFPRK